ncbi:DHA2 family efflux MFS transporter permease subunit [Streptomyces harbinensis]|uniref:DHA2 family efflux MFS transporter permease subunit n=1 Tax=Streptomyces harbinensis TaxID=1176198 RepID=UPI0036C1E43E
MSTGPISEQTSPPATPERPPAGPPPPRLGALATVIILGSVMIVLDTTIVAIAYPTLAQEFGAAITTVQWISSGYTLALAAVIPTAGWAMNRFGNRRVYLTAITAFTLSSALAGLAWSMESLIAFRVVQGLAGGLVSPVGMAVMLQAAAARGRDNGKVMSLLGIPILIAPLTGPLLGGMLIDSVSWRWMFLINVPIGALAIALALRLLPPGEPRSAHRLDVPGLLMLSPGLAALIYGLTRGAEGEDGMLTPGALLPAAAGTALMISFALRALRTPEPLVQLRLLAQRRIALGVATVFLFATGYFGSMMLAPIYFQSVRGASVLTAGLLGAPLALASGTVMQVATRLTDKVAPRWIVVPGVLLGLAGFASFALQAQPDTPYWRLMLSMAVIGAGGGMTLMPSIAAATRGLPADRAPAASTLIAICSQIAASLGAAAVSLLMSGRLTESFTTAPATEVTEAVRHGYLWPLASVLLALLVALRVSRDHPDRTDRTA